MLKRIFIAINPDKGTKQNLEFEMEEMKREFQDEVIKWTKRENLHITLLFLGSIKEERLEKIDESLSKVTFTPFKISLDKISYMPEDRRHARMIWAQGSADKSVSNLYNQIKESSTCLGYAPDKGFNLHITLGRIKKWKFNKIPLEEIPILEKDIDLNFNVSSFELMESKLSRGGAEYKILKSYQNKT